MTVPSDAWDGLPTSWEVESYFDGGDTGCGEMLLDLRIHFRALGPGTRVAILARDVGSPVEIPAWCRLTGHHLVAAGYPYYLAIVREDDSNDPNKGGR